jgi:hypothetical protein
VLSSEHQSRALIANLLLEFPRISRHGFIPYTCIPANSGTGVCNYDYGDKFSSLEIE